MDDCERNVIIYCSFPSDSRERQQWIDVIANHNDSRRTAKQPYYYKHHRKHRVCERHFSPDSFITLNNKKYLKPKSVPIVFNRTSSTQEINEIHKLADQMTSLHRQFINKVVAVNKTTEVNTILNNVRCKIMEIFTTINQLCENELC